LAIRFTALALAALFAPAVLAQVNPPLGNAQNFSVLGGTPNVNNTGPTVVTGSLGVFPAAAVIGFPPGIVTGAIERATPAAASAQASATVAYNFLAAEACTTTFAVPTDLAGQTLPPGVYCFASSGSNTGLLQLDPLGNPNAVWVFKTVSTWITGPGSTMTMLGAGSSCNVWFQVGSSATLDTTTTMLGNIIALTDISLLTGATLSGRAFARNGQVTLATNQVGGCALAFGTTGGIPTLSEWAMVLLASLLAMAGFVAMRKRSK
jgi:hypothetical protein